MFKAGASKVVITPPVGFRMAGYEKRTQKSIGVHDDLYAKALVLDDGADKVALVSCDVLGVSKEIISKVRQLVEADLGIKGSNVMVAATHTHSGPDLLIPDQMEYANMLDRKIAGSIRAAYHNLAEARLGAGQGEAVIGFNRRNPNKPRLPHFPEGYACSPYPEGIKDSEVGVLRVDDSQGNLIAAIVNTPCHCVVLGCTNLLFSADFAGYATQVIEKLKGGITLFLNGCCGNINPVNTDGVHTVIKGKTIKGPDLYREAERLGNILGGEALKVLEQIETTSEVKLKAKRSEVILPVRKDIPETWTERIKSVKPGSPQFERYTGILRGESIRTEVQAIALDDAVIVGVPCEVFVEFGLQIKKNSPYKTTIVSELANDSFGYIPTAKAFEEGGYESKIGSLMEPDGGRKLSEAAINVLKS